MDAAHHLARQIIEGGDIELEDGKGGADGIGEMRPPAGAEPLREAVLEIVEFDLVGRGCAVSPRHRFGPYQLQYNPIQKSRHCEERSDEAIHSATKGTDGLLRFA